MTGALAGDKEFAAAFQGVGISVEELKDLKDLAPEQIFLRLADAFKNSDNGLAKQAVLLKLMGRSGETMMNALNDGADAWRERLGQMREDDQILSKEQLAASREFDGAWNRIAGTLEGLKNSLGLDLAQTFLSLLDRLREWLTLNRDLINDKFTVFPEHIPPLVESLTRAFSALDIALSPGCVD